MFALAASLSTCIYQSLCDSHSYSGEVESCPFTGLAYRGCLLRERQRRWTETFDGSLVPTTSPAQWPGVAALQSQLSSAREEDSPKLSVLLCEALVAVYLALLARGLAGPAPGLLFRLAVHRLDARMWAAVFGGGAKVPDRAQLSQTDNPSATLSDEASKHRCRLNLRLLSAEAHRNGRRHSQDKLIYREQFLSPEISIWDYFIAKPFSDSSNDENSFDSDESATEEEEEEEEEEEGYEKEDEVDEQRHSQSPRALRQEHMNPNSYSWTLMQLAMVRLTLHNLREFFPMAGLDMAELPGQSPLCHAVMCSLHQWEAALERKIYELSGEGGGPPAGMLPGIAVSHSGPAILRHKAMLEPGNTPFRNAGRGALPARRLWCTLIRQEPLTETFIHYIFSQNRQKNNVVRSMTVHFVSFITILLPKDKCSCRRNFFFLFLIVFFFFFLVFFFLFFFYMQHMVVINVIGSWGWCCAADATPL
uniref:Uncharacterized protein n=1 Tax=Eptatretus burgeri TaxID=7764 RepID=A0A8C4NJ91_EPTBU